MIALSPPSSPQSRRRVDAIREHFYGGASRLPLPLRGVVLVGTALCCLLLLLHWQDGDLQSWAGSPALLRAKTWATSTAGLTRIKMASEAQDDAAWFVEMGITPASWTRTFNPPTVSLARLRRSVVYTDDKKMMVIDSVYTSMSLGRAC